MSAAAVRVDLVGLSGRIEGSPDELKIQVWLGQLSNAEVLARMYRIRPTHDYDPDVILQNVQVLESLGDESAAFARAGQHADGLH